LRARFVKRVIDEQSSILSSDKVRALLRGKVPEADLEAKTAQLLDAAITKRLAAGDSVTVPLDTMEAAQRERFVRLAAAHRAPRHLTRVGIAKAAAREAAGEPLGELRTALDAGELGQEGFMTSLRLGGRVIDELKKIVFSPPPSDD